MYKGATVGVVVPAYNESGFVGEVIETIPEFVDRVYAVDDGSSDRTWDEMQAAAWRVNERAATVASAAPDGGATSTRQVVTLRHEDNRGVGAAITTGYREALADGMDVVAVMNGDGQMDPEILDRIVDPVVEGEADYAKGNRLNDAHHRAAMSGWRLFGNVVLTFLTRVASGYWRTTDPQNGYTAISREALEALDFDVLHDHYGFCNDLLVRLNAAGMRVADVPMRAVYGDEESHIRYRSFVPMLSWLLLVGFLWRLRTTYLDDGVHPLAAMYATGVAGWLGGVAGVAWWLATGGDDGLRGVATVFLVGAVALGLAVAAEWRTNGDLEVHR